MIEHEHFYYVVNLIDGEITFTFNEHKDGPFKYTKSLKVADYYSLNVLRQNIQENKVKDIPISETITRMILGQRCSTPCNEVLEKMKELKENYPEDFI